MHLPLDAITTIFIFLIGVPAILLQQLAPELRKVVRRRKLQLVFFTVLPIFVAGVIVTCGMWLEHVKAQNQIAAQQAHAQAHDAQTSAVADSSSALNDITQYEGQLLWVFILTTLVLISGFTAVLLSDRWRREVIIKQMQNRAAKRIPKFGRLVESELHELIQLGKHSSSGSNKELVLEAMSKLACAVQEHQKYDGRQLEVLIMGLSEVLNLGHGTGSAENYRTAADVLSQIVIESGRARHADDLRVTVHSISILACACLRLNVPHLPMKFVEALELLPSNASQAVTAMSETLFEIGSQAIRYDQALVAMAALSKLDGLAQRQPRVEGELAHDYLSLAAHLWRHGETAQRYVGRMLSGISHLFTLELPEAVHEAHAHCELTAKFVTSDYLLAMQRELREIKNPQSRVRTATA